MNRKVAFHWSAPQLVCLAVLFAWPIAASAGGGRIRVVNEPTGMNGTFPIDKGLIDLNVSLAWDPSETNPAPMWTEEELKKQFRTASTVLCDATDGRFRIGRVNFFIDPLGRAESDIWYYDFEGNNSGATYDLGKYG